MSNVNHASLLEVQSATSARLDAELTKSRALNTELLEFVQEWLDRQGTDENYLVAKARAAIAKARGE